MLLKKMSLLSITYLSFILINSSVNAQDLEYLYGYDYSKPTKNEHIETLHTARKENPSICLGGCEEICRIDPWFCSACRKICEE